MVVAAGVCAGGVVVVEVFAEVAPQRGEFGYERAGEAGSPAFLEDGELDPLDASVAGWRPALMRRWRAPVAATVWRKSGEVNSEPLSVVTRWSFQPASASSCARR